MFKIMMCVALLVFSQAAYADDSENPFNIISKPKKITEAEAEAKGVSDIVVKPFDKTSEQRIVMYDSQGVKWCLVPGDDYMMGSCPTFSRCAYAVFVECGE